MKQKPAPREERRRPMAELNLLEESRRINVRRRGCGPLFGSTLLLAVAAAALLAGLR